MRKMLFCILVSIFLISCGGGNKTGSDRKNTATVNIEREPKSLDPQLVSEFSGFIVNNMTFENLVRLDAENKVVPAGAEKYEVSEDGLIWTFYLRKDAKWSNGDPVTAKDFYNGFLRGVDPKTGSEYIHMAYYIKGIEDYAAGKTKDVNELGIKVIDDYTFQIELAQSTGYFDKLLLLPIFSPINEKAIKEHGDKYATEANRAIYNGPYTMTEWEHGGKIKMTKNEHYWNKDNIKIENIVAVIIGDYDAAANVYENDELDLTKISTEKSLKYKDKPELFVHPNGRVFYLAFNQNNEFLKNKKIRQALSLAIDRGILTKDILMNGSEPASGIVGPGATGESKDFRVENGNLYEKYKDEDLQKLLDEGLKEIGEKREDVKLTLTADLNGTGKKEAEFYQGQWKEKLGIKVDVEVVTEEDRYSKGLKHDFEIIRYSWGPDYTDAMTYLELLMSKSKSLNISRYNNPEYDRFIEVAQSVTDNKERVDAMKQAEAIATDDFPYTGLYYMSATYLKSPRLKDVVIRGPGAPIDFYYASIKE